MYFKDPVCSCTPCSTDFPYEYNCLNYILRPSSFVDFKNGFFTILITEWLISNFLKNLLGVGAHQE